MSDTTKRSEEGTALGRLKQRMPQVVQPDTIVHVRVDDLAKALAVVEACKPFKAFADKRPFGGGPYTIPEDISLTLDHLRALQDAMQSMESP